MARRKSDAVLHCEGSVNDKLWNFPSPKPGFISSRPSTGGEFANMYGLPSDRKHLIETKEGYLMGICDKTNKLCRFYIIDDTYVVQIPSILKLKKLLGELPLPPIDPNFKVKSRFRK